MIYVARTWQRLWLIMLLTLPHGWMCPVFQGSTCRAVQLRKSKQLQRWLQFLFYDVVQGGAAVRERANSLGGGGVGKSHRAPPLKSTRQKGKVEAHPMNIHRHIQSAIVKYELCHNIEKGHPNPNMFTLDMSGHIHIVDFWQLWLFKWTAQSRRIKSIKRMDGRPKWMTDLALNLSKHVRTREA